MSRLLLFSRDPGGTNAVIPLIKPLLERGYELLIYSKDTAFAKYHHAGIDSIDIMQCIPAITMEAITDFINILRPDVVVTGTSADDFVEKYLWSASGNLNIPSLAIIDQWVNYGLRFSQYGVNNIVEYSQDRAHPYLPTRIAVMDDYARNEMIIDGLPAERIAVCGQPYFQSFLSCWNNSCNLEQFCESRGVAQDDYVVVFASEPITTTYGKWALDYWGYTEKTILNALVRSLEKVVGETHRQVMLVVRPHPKEGCDHFIDIVEQCRCIRWCFDTDSTSLTLMKRADLVCGMSSMFLIESVIVGRPVMSIQIGLDRDNPFVLARRGIVKSILSEEELIDKLQKSVIRGETEISKFDVVTNPVERTIDEVEKLLCQSLL